MKRDESSAGLSPPPSKRKVESTTTGKAIANFFTPTSKKEPARLTWRTVNDSLLAGRYSASPAARPIKRRKIAAFDFDSTLVQTISGNIFSKDAEDWKWWDASVPPKLKSLYADGYEIAVISNQGGMRLRSDSKTIKGDLKRLNTFKGKVGLVLNQLDLPINVLAATGIDEYRKPRAGMWRELLDELDLDEGDGPDLDSSFFVGDAAGRIATKNRKADFSCSDRNLAANIGINFLTPEEFFLGQQPLEWRRTFDPASLLRDEEPTLNADYKPSSNPEIVLLCGSPGSGKSTFYFDVLRPLSYERVNQDTLKSREKCLKAGAEVISQKKPLAVDNTNADQDTRAKWIELARASKVPIRCVVLDTPAEVCRHNDMVRALNEGHFNPEKRTLLPSVAFNGFAGRFKEPSLDEGFQDIVRIPFKFKGDASQRETWSKFWI